MVAPLASSSAPVSALGKISCTGPEIAMTTRTEYYGVDLFNTETRTFRRIISSTLGGRPSETGTIVVPNMYQVNQVGLLDGGERLIFTAMIGETETTGTPHVIDVNLVTGEVFKLPTQVASVAGGVNLVDGKFYFGGYTQVAATAEKPAGYVAKLSTYDPNTRLISNELGLEVFMPLATGGNGDLMFDSDGNLFIVASGGAGGTATIYRINAPLPVQRPVTLTGQQFARGDLGDVVNGLAFGNDGYIYSSGSAIRIFKGNGDLVEQLTSLEGTARGTDMASCVDPPRVRLYKDLPNGRVKLGDQFGLEVSGPAIDAGNKTVTQGDEPGLQEEFDNIAGTAEFVGPLLVRPGDVVTLTETAAVGTNLADYATNLTCTDESTSAEVPVAGSGTSRQITMPISVFGQPGANIKCVYTNVAAPSLTIQKSLPEGRLVDTDQFTVSITPGDAKATTTGTATGVQSAKAVLDPAAYDTTYTFTEQASGSTNLDYYKTSWACNDLAANGASLGSGVGTSGTISIKSGSSIPDVVCTFTNIPEKPDLSVKKSVNPASGTAVVAGQKLTYNVEFSNTGGAPAAVDYVDDIAGVLDDATITLTPRVSSGSGLLVSSVVDGKFTMKGQLPPGATSKVTYEVQVKPDGQRTDNLLENFVIKPGETTPGDCLDSNDLCTVNPVPELVYKKDVDPADGSTVFPDQVLTYTMTFDNTKGASPAPVDMVDNLAGVLDDATVVEDPKLATGGGLTVSAITDGEFTIKGQVAAGGISTVTYKVKVKPDNERGDSLLENFLLPPGNPPPEGGCPPNDSTCTSNPVPGLGVTKDVVPEDGSTVVVGQELLYTITFKNTGAAAADVDKVDDLSGILDDATVTENPKLATGTGLTVSAIADGKFTIKGQIQPGATATVTMKVVVRDADNRGDNVLLNFVLPPDTPTPGTCAPGDPLCTENPVSNLEVVKDVVPEDGSTVLAGQELTYTLTFTNDGAAAAAVDKVDNLAGILDDATITADPILATGDGLAVSPIANGQFTITGSLAAGATATVTMKVVVKADGERGDNVLLNFVIEPGKTPPEECQPNDPLCTRNPVPGLGKAKSVDPEDGSTVVAEQELTYTLTFTNTGAAAGMVDETDNMAGVLDDATIVEEPKLATGEGLEVSAIDEDGKFTIKGELAAGATATVTMKVVVKADGERGDDVLLNFLGEGDECVDGDPLCTRNPVAAPKIDLLKEVDSVDDLDNNGSNTLGDIIRYKFTVTNTGNNVLSDIELTDPLFSDQPLECPKQTLEPAEVMVCVGAAHTITAADVAELAVRNTATVTGVDPEGKEVEATSSVVVPVVVVNPPTSTTTVTPTTRVTSRPTTGSGSARSFGIAAGLSLALGASLIALSRTRRQHA